MMLSVSLGTHSERFRDCLYENESDPSYNLSKAIDVDYVITKIQQISDVVLSERINSCFKAKQDYIKLFISDIVDLKPRYGYLDDDASRDHHSCSSSTSSSIFGNATPL